MSAKVTQASKLHNGQVSLMARVAGNNAVNIAQASVSAITYSVVDKRSGSTIVGATSTLSKTVVVFDTLQTDGRWVDQNGNAIDSTGYNFRYDLPPAQTPTRGRTYRVEILITPTTGVGGAAVPLAFDVTNV